MGAGLMRTKQYRCNAEHYLNSARRMSNAEARAALTDMAAYWIELAERADAERPASEKDKE